MNVAIFSSLYNYNIEQIKPWVNSLIQTKFGGKVFVVVYDNTSKEVLDYLKQNNIYIYQARLNPEINISSQRFVDWVALSESEHCNDVDIIITTDIKDIVFQSDPGVWIKQNIKDYDLISTSEGVKYIHEDWNGENLEKHFGRNMFNSLSENETLCAGIIAGKRKMMIKLFNIMHDLLFFSENPTIFGLDQICYNIAIYKIFLHKTKIVPASENWCGNLGTLKAIPELTPSWSTQKVTHNFKFERNRNIQTFKDALLCKMPYMNGDIVYAENRKPYCIVHQYDRYKPWADILVQKY